MIWITQLLCEHRHCMYAIAWDDKDGSEKEAENMLDEQGGLLTALGFGVVRCRICRSTTLHKEHGRTAFATLEEATPALAVSQALNIASGDLMEQLNAAKRKGSN